MGQFMRDSSPQHKDHYLAIPFSPFFVTTKVAGAEYFRPSSSMAASMTPIAFRTVVNRTIRHNHFSQALEMKPPVLPISARSHSSFARTPPGQSPTDRSMMVVALRALSSTLNPFPVFQVSGP